MIRITIRLVSCVLAIFVSVLSVQLVEDLQSSFPLDTQHGVTVSVAQSSLTKSELVSGLDEMADSKGMTLLKVAADPDDVENATDLVWFGSVPPTAQDSVTWFDPSRTGKFVSSRNLGERPIDGYFVFSDCVGCVAAWGSWADTSGATLQWGSSKSVVGAAVGFLANTGGGLATLCIVVLLVSVALMWFVSVARARSIRLLGGVRPLLIHTDDIGSISMMVGAWSVFGWILSVLWVLAFRGPARLRMVVGWSAGLLLLADLAVIVVCVLVSFMTRPTVAAVATRRPPLRAFARMSSGIRILGVLLAVTVLPFTLAYTQSASYAYAQAARWADARGAVTVTVSGLIDDDVSMAPHREDWEAFLADADAEELTALSWTYDEMVISDDRDMGDFDHVVITDPAFLRLMQFDSRDLVPVAPDEVPDSLRQELGQQFEILTTDQRQEPIGSHWYTNAPGTTVPVIVGSLGGGTPTTAKHPLLIVVDHPLTAFTFSGFTLSMMVNGNMIFTDADRLRELISVHHLETFIISIDNVADETLDAAQAFSRQAQLGVAATVLVMLALGVSVVQSAQTWAGTNARRIFARRTAGEGYSRIAAIPLLRESAFIVVICVAAGLASGVIYGTSAAQMLITGSVFIPLYIAGTAFAYRLGSAQAFGRVLHREA